MNPTGRILFSPITETWRSLSSSLSGSLVELGRHALPSLLMAAKATSTTNKYAADWRRWEAWATTKSIQTFPVAPYHLALYIADLSSKKAKTVADSAAAAISWAHNIAGIQSPTNNPIVRSALQGFRRLHASPTVRKEPITPAILECLLENHGQTASLTDLRILFICFLSYAGFLRFDELSNLRRKDCVASPDHLCLHLQKSKADQFRQGADVIIARTGKPTCPVSIAERYFSAMGDAHDSAMPVLRRLVNTKEGIRPTQHKLSYTRAREIVLNALKPIVPDIASYGLHSLRSGGATAAHNAQVPPVLISKHGRWKTEQSRNKYLKNSLQINLLPSMSIGI